MGTTEAVKIKPGALVGKYRIVRVTRKTADTAFVDARDEESMDMVALKLATTSLEPDAAAAAVGQLGDTLERVRNPHVVPVRDSGASGYWGYQRIAPVTAGLLADAIEGGDKFSAVECLRMANDMATGLQALHEAGVAHGNLSPENILLARQNRARLFGAGLVAALNPPSEDRDTDPKTPDPYAAPERAKQGASPSADLFSLGLILYELLTGRQAAATVAGYNPRARDSQSPRPPARFKEVAPHLPRPLEILTFSLLQAKPEDRCRSAAEFRARIRQIVQASQRRTPRTNN